MLCHFFFLFLASGAGGVFILGKFFFFKKKKLERFQHYCVVTNFVIIKHKAMS